MKTVYHVSDAENRTGILDDEVKNIDKELPRLPSFKNPDQKKKALLDQFREQVKDHIQEIEGHYFHTDIYLARYILLIRFLPFSPTTTLFSLAVFLMLVTGR